MAAIFTSLRRKSFPLFFELLRLRYFSHSPSFLCTASAHRTASPYPHFMVEYLAVLSSMRSPCFGSDDLRKLITWMPRFLCSHVKGTPLAPELQCLHSIRFSESDLVDVLVAQPTIIHHNFSQSLLPKLKMWEGIFGSRELRIKPNKSSYWFLHCNNEKIASNMKFLRVEWGIPDASVYRLLRSYPNFILQTTDSFRALAVRVEELGVPRKSGKFLRALISLSMVSKDGFEAKLKLMRTLGWLDCEFIFAITKSPRFLCLPQELLRKKVEFFLKKVGCSSCYLAQYPVVLCYSLEKRIIPRFRVMELLKSEGLRQPRPYTFLAPSDGEFRERFVLRHKHKFPNCTAFCELLLDEKGDDSSHLHLEYTKKVSQS